MADWLSRLMGSDRLNSEQQRQFKIKVLCLLVIGCLFFMFAIFMLSEGTTTRKI